MGHSAATAVVIAFIAQIQNHHSLRFQPSMGVRRNKSSGNIGIHTAAAEILADGITDQHITFRYIDLWKHVLRFFQ